MYPPPRPFQISKKDAFPYAIVVGSVDAPYCSGKKSAPNRCAAAASLSQAFQWPVQQHGFVSNGFRSIGLCSQYSAIRPLTYGATVFHHATSPEPSFEPRLNALART